MSFGSTPTTGSQFGAAAAWQQPGSAPTSAPQTGFSLGTASIASTGFSLGNLSTPSTGFSFANVATTASSGFSIHTTATTAAPAATAGFSFGAPVSSSGGFQFGSGTASTTNAPIFSLGSTLQSNPLASKPPPSSTVATGFLFGATSQQSSMPKPATNFGATTLASGTFNFASQSTATATTTAVVNPLSGFSMGSAPLGQSSTSLFTASATPTASTNVAAVAPTLTFGATSTAAAATTACAAVAPVVATTTVGFSFKTGATSLSIAKTSGATTTTTGLSALSATAAPAKQMSYKELEDTVEKWLHDLGEQEKAFLSQAAQVNTWDKQLIENGEKVTELNNEVERVKTDQQRLDRELDFILSQQEELEELLQPIEVQVKSQQMVQHIQHSDIERERTYNLAENIDAQLKRMMEDLREIIDRINNSNVNPNQGADETMAQIGKILNSHMDSLQWVDQNTNQLQKRVEDVNQLMESHRVENDKTFHLYDRE